MSYAANSSELQNPNPIIYQSKQLGVQNEKERKMKEMDEEIEDEFDNLEIFDIIRHINDPEHPLSLEQLNVVTPENIFVDNRSNTIDIFFTPTIPHCTMATLIGLMIRVKLLRSLPSRFKVRVLIEPGKHSSEHAINKQLADKERVAAALENQHLIGVVNKGVFKTDRIDPCVE